MYQIKVAKSNKFAVFYIPKELLEIHSQSQIETAKSFSTRN